MVLKQQVAQTGCAVLTITRPPRNLIAQIFEGNSHNEELSEEKDRLVRQFLEVADVDQPTAIACLESTEWNLDAAIEWFCRPEGETVALREESMEPPVEWRGVEHWLIGLDMEEYWPAFHREHVTDRMSLLELEEADLEKLGVMHLGPR